jgi:1-acyl-sn-glycerol-3-phosphate acyltransferase
MKQRDLSIYHERIRTRGVNGPVYWVVRGVLQPLMHVWFRLRRIGREHIPRKGPVILAANHRSFLDPWIVGVCLRRPVYFVAKQELFERRLLGWFLNSLGAFPIRRGESDEEAMRTARAVLERGAALVIFPEGTRIRTGALGKPKRGVGRLALETGAPVVPIALFGTERARRGWIVRPVRIRARCGRPLTFPHVENPSPRLAAGVTERLWRCIDLQWLWLGGEAPTPEPEPQPVEPLRAARAARGRAA